MNFGDISSINDAPFSYFTKRIEHHSTNEHLLSKPYEYLYTDTSSVTLQAPTTEKIDELYFKKNLLLKKRNQILLSFTYRIFKMNRNKLDLIDQELDKIEFQISSLTRVEINQLINETRAFLNMLNQDSSC